MNETNTENAVARAPRGSSPLAIPAAIIIGFGLIAASIYLSGGKQAAVAPGLGNQSPTADLSKVDPITADDHIRGNPNAPLLIVEYSDFDCPFCQRFHTTMQKIMDEYGPGGQVAWVYRHWPITSLHPSAGHIAEASECVAELGGNEAFWKFADLVFGERGSTGSTDLVRLPEFAETVGVSKADYESCVASGRHREGIEDNAVNAAEIGAIGTPYSVVIVGDQKTAIDGAQPYETVKLLIDGLLR